jgi:hypothetical protein
LTGKQLLTLRRIDIPLWREQRNFTFTAILQPLNRRRNEILEDNIKKHNLKKICPVKPYFSMSSKNYLANANSTNM